jgi:hypothetical protein
MKVLYMQSVKMHPMEDSHTAMKRTQHRDMPKCSNEWEEEESEQETLKFSQKGILH